MVERLYTISIDGYRVHRIDYSGIRIYILSIGKYGSGTKRNRPAHRRGYDGYRGVSCSTPAGGSADR